MWEKAHPKPRSEKDWEDYARHYTRLAERWLDDGYGSCVLGKKERADLVSSALLHFQHGKYFLSSFVIMPNHCHLSLKPESGNTLESIVGSWKQYTALRINRELNKDGALWEQEFYDRIIRDSEHLHRVLQYIGRNPRKAGLPGEDWRCWICPEWEEAGWCFHQEMP
jgi:REP element-mobilizing transposase RayT